MRASILAFVTIVAGATGLTAASGLAGWARLVDGRSIAAEPPMADDATQYRLASSGAPSTSYTIYSSQTVSFALDRIDQRDLPLDRIYRHPATGKGVTVYVFDGGVSPTHPELAGRVRVGFSAFPGDEKICNPHGTAVAGAIAGATLGVAPGASIVDVKMVECARQRGTIRAILDGARWVIADHATHPGPAIANWSFIADTSTRIPAVDSAVSALRAVGIPVIVSAGNLEIDACRVSPGNSRGTIVVGASEVTTQRADDGSIVTVDRRAPGTAYGPCIDLYAPGDSVLLPSLDRDLTPISQLWNGTSMAAGYVSGAAALYLETHPAATPDQVARDLEGGATMNVLRDTKADVSRLLYVGARDSSVASGVRRATRVAARH